MTKTKPPSWSTSITSLGLLIVGMVIMMVSIQTMLVGYHNVDLMINGVTWNNCDWDGLHDIHNPNGDSRSAVEFYLIGRNQMLTSLWYALIGAALFGLGLGSMRRIA